LTEWIQADWPPYSPDLNAVDFSICSILQPKDQSMPHANLATQRPSIAAEWDWLAAVQILKTCLKFRRPQEAATKKNYVCTE
jgi:hypothetical protein